MTYVDVNRPLKYKTRSLNPIEAIVVGGILSVGCVLGVALWALKIILIVLLIVLALDFVGVIDPFDL